MKLSCSFLVTLISSVLTFYASAQTATSMNQSGLSLYLIPELSVVELKGQDGNSSKLFGATNFRVTFSGFRLEPVQIISGIDYNGKHYGYNDFNNQLTSYFDKIKVSSISMTVYVSGLKDCREFSYMSWKTGDNVTNFCTPVPNANVAITNYSISSVQLSGVYDLQSKIRELEAGEKQKQSKKNEYDKLVTQADNDLDAGNYANARANYQSAQKLMPDESYPASQLERIDQLEQEAKQKEEAAKEEGTTSTNSNDETENTSTQQNTQSKEQAQLEQQERERQEALERQKKYDAWKADRDAANTKAASEAATGMIAALVGIGTIIYGDMGDVDLDKTYTSPSLQDGKYRPTFYHGWEIGLSGTLFPMLFPSVKETMVNGSYVTLSELQGVHAFTVNLEGQFKMGAEADNYGFYGYLYPRVGTSIIFDAFNLSWQNYGGRVFAGLKHAKVYFDYSSGVRQFTYSPLFSTEETGKSKVEQGFVKQEFGLRFTTNPDNASRRTHLSIGIIQETFKVEDDYRYLNPDWYGNSATITGKTRVLTGYAFQWKKDHYFNFYANFYPEFYYSGNTGGAWSDKLTNKPTNFFAELGYIKVIDTFKARKGR